MSRFSDAPTQPLLEDSPRGPAQVWVGPGVRAPDDVPADEPLDLLPRPPHTNPALTPRVLAPRESDRPIPMAGFVEVEPEPLDDDPSTFAGQDTPAPRHTPPPPEARDHFSPDMRMLLALEGIERHLGDLAQSHRKMTTETEASTKHKAQLVSELQRILGEQLGAVLKNSGAGKELCNLVLPILGIERRKAETITSSLAALVSVVGALATVGGALWATLGGGW